MESGYNRILIDSWVASINPTRWEAPWAQKPISKIKTLTETVTLAWEIKDSDKHIKLEWDCLDKADLDELIVFYEGADTHTFKDPKGQEWVVQVEDLVYKMVGFLEEDGYVVTLSLQVISKV